MDKGGGILNGQRIMILEFGTAAMFILMILRRKHYPQIGIWKMFAVSVLLTVSGVAGAMLMHFIESGSFSGTSFFGSVLFIPVFMTPVMLMRIPYKIIMDLCAPSVSLMLAFMKFDCLISGCCIGKYLPSLGFQIPSQIVEMVVALIIVAVLLKIETETEYKGSLYGWYFVIYGLTRFVLNWFRYGVKPFVWILPAGNFWSIISVVSGIIWLLIIKKKNTNF